MIWHGQRAGPKRAAERALGASRSCVLCGPWEAAAWHAERTFVAKAERVRPSDRKWRGNPRERVVRFAGLSREGTTADG